MLGLVYMPNGIAITLLLVLLFSANRVSNHVLLDAKMFYRMLLCNLFQCIGEIIAYAIDGRGTSGFRLLALLVNAGLFIFNILFAYLWVVYADYKIFGDVERIKKRSKILMLPALLIVLGSVINLFVPVFFKITQDNHYQRTGLFFLPYLVTYFYLSYGTVFIYKYKKQAGKYVFLPAIVFMLPIICGSVLQYLFYGMSTVWIGVAIALTTVYINVQNEASYIDVLSGLYTRLYMYQYLETELRRKEANKKIAGIMLDIDEFKKINDTYGQLMGDDAIRSVGKILHATLGEKGIAIRYGGDEFVILQQIQTEEDVIRTLEQLTHAERIFNHTENKQYTLHFSKGYSVLDTTADTVDSFLERMDRAMYQVKRARNNS